MFETKQVQNMFGDFSSLHLRRSPESSFPSKCYQVTFESKVANIYVDNEAQMLLVNSFPGCCCKTSCWIFEGFVFTSIFKTQLIFNHIFWEKKSEFRRAEHCFLGDNRENCNPNFLRWFSARLFFRQNATIAFSFSINAIWV